MPVRIDQLPTTTNPTDDHVLPAMLDGLTVRLTVAQINGLKNADNSGYDGLGDSVLDGVTNVKGALDILGAAATELTEATNLLATTRHLRNRVINGGFGVNQRAAGNTVAAGVFRFDRWKGGAAGCTASAVASGRYNVVTITAGTLVQVIEDQLITAGDYTLSWVGSAQVRVSIGAGAFTGWASSPVTLAGVADKVTVTIELGVGTVEKVQLELGDAPTPFDVRPEYVELNLCKRYYQVSSGSEACNYGASTAGHAISHPVKFDVVMRAIPTIVATYTTTTLISSSITAWYSSVSGYIHYMVASGAGNARMVWTWTASAEL